MRLVSVILISFLFVTAFYLLYQWKKCGPKGEGAAALTLKGMATLGCTGLAIYGAVICPDMGHWMLAAGLLVCTAADVLLGIRFMPGMACFAFGHVCYCNAYCLFAPPTWTTWIVFIILALLVMAVIPWARKHAGKNIAPFIAYGLVLCLMLALASGQKIVLLLGAFMFVVSDVLLGYRLAKNIQGRVYDYLCLGCYYLAQFLIGASVVIG